MLLFKIISKATVCRKKEVRVIFKFLKRDKTATHHPNCAVFVDYEHWYIALDKNYHVKPDINAFTEELKKDYHISSFTFFGDFSNPSLQNEMHKIRGYTNDIVETKNGGGYFKKDFTDFIMLDRIYQSAYTRKDIDTYVIFTGDGHFSSAVLFLKNVCRKKVCVYGVKNAFSSQLRTAASISREIEPDKLYEPCRLLIESIYDLETENKDARPTFMKTIDAVASKNDMDKGILRQAMEQLFDRGCVSQFVKKIGKNQVKLLKVDYKVCKKYGYFDK